MTHAPKTAPCGCLSCTLEHTLRLWGKSRKPGDKLATTDAVLEQIGFFCGSAFGNIAMAGAPPSGAQMLRMNSAYERGFHRGVAAGSDGQIETSSKTVISGGEPHGRTH